VQNKGQRTFGSKAKKKLPNPRQSMKVGDLVRCNFQPKCGGYDSKKQRLMPMEHTIKGEVGFIITIGRQHHTVMFPQFGYAHPLATSVLEVISA